MRIDQKNGMTGISRSGGRDINNRENQRHQDRSADHQILPSNEPNGQGIELSRRDKIASWTARARSTGATW